MQQSPVFEQTYQGYLKRIAEIELAARADILGAQQDGDGLRIPLFNTVYRLSAEGIRAPDGQVPSLAVRVVLSQYVLRCPADLPVVQTRLMAYREFKDAAPLVGYFASNTIRAIEQAFSGKPEQLAARCAELDAAPQSQSVHDLSLQIMVLPRIPVLLNYNDRDDLFPAQCSVLYRASAAHFLDMESLAITGTLLAETLVQDN